MLLQQPEQFLPEPQTDVFMAVAETLGYVVKNNIQAITLVSLTIRIRLSRLISRVCNVCSIDTLRNISLINRISTSDLQDFLC